MESNATQPTKFFNWTDEDFTHTWGGRPYVFKAGEKDGLDDFSSKDRPAIAAFFAKHLAVRELHKEGLQANDQKFGAYMDKAVIDGKQVAPEAKKSEFTSEIKGKK